MAGFNHDELFEPIKHKVEMGELRTVNSLRLILEEAGEKFDVTTLNMLLLFREWLEEKDILLSTENGAVTFSKLSGK
tara:strand:- start:128 stop:358 length:231 start_codon:yes stop_codon:yes gene_type:complete